MQGVKGQILTTLLPACGVDAASTQAKIWLGFP